MAARAGAAAIYTVCVLRLGGRYPALQINAMATTAAPTTTGGVILAIKLGKFKSVAYRRGIQTPRDSDTNDLVGRTNRPAHAALVAPRRSET